MRTRNPYLRRTSDAFRTSREVIRSRGFEAETHQLTTWDGYILTMDRIVHPTTTTVTKTPVLLMNGFGLNGTTWIASHGDGHLEADDGEDSEDSEDGKERKDKEKKGEEREGDKYDGNLGFCLAKEGHDVWIAHVRSSRGSRRHSIYTADQDKYWDFTLDDMIENDLPAMIKFILDKAESKTLAFVGFSTGTTLMLGLLATQPEYNELIKPCILISPSWQRQSSFTQRMFVRLAHSNWRRNPKLKPKVDEDTEDKFIRMINRRFFGGVAGFFSYLYFRTLSGYKCKIDRKRFSVFCAQVSLVVPRKAKMQLAQFMINSKPCKFDHGSKKNLEVYGTESPPVYDIGQITNKYICLMYSSNDWGSLVKDVEALKETLKVELFDDYLVKNKRWTHYDFLMAKDCKNVVNSRIVKCLDKINTL